MNISNPEERAKRLPPDSRQLYETFRESGMGPGAALAATAGRDGQIPSVDPNEEQLEAFQAGGLSEAGAKAAMTGRRLGESMEVREDGAKQGDIQLTPEEEQKAIKKWKKEMEQAAARVKSDSTTGHTESGAVGPRAIKESLSPEELSALRQSEFYRKRFDQLAESMSWTDALEQAEEEALEKLGELLDEGGNRNRRRGS